MKQAIFICGPTASGKTAFAIKLAQRLGVEIVSFDSRQFYKELPIGSAFPSDEELKAIKHHFIGHLDIHHPWDAGTFEKEALALLDQLFKKHQRVVLVGGSGLYMRALTRGFDDMPKVPEEIRQSINHKLETQGIKALQGELKEKDPKYAETIDLQNPQRLIRALEVITFTGKPYSSLRKGTKKIRPFKITKIAVDMERKQLYSRINQRVEMMMQMGLKQEAKGLLPHKSANPLQTVGYKELFAHFEGQFTLEEAVEEIKKNTRRFAKRQMTWFRREEDIHWLKPTELDLALEIIYGKTTK